MGLNKETSFAFNSIEDKQEFSAYAKAKGLTLSQLARFATYQYKAIHPLSASEKAGDRKGRGRPRQDIKKRHSELSEGIPDAVGVGRE